MNKIVIVACHYYLCFLLLVLRSFDGYTAQIIAGKDVRCEKDGEEVKITNITDDPCLTCKCQKDVVICQRQACPQAKNCYFIAVGQNRPCCGNCLDCHHEGQIYMNGVEWKASGDPCLTYTCQSGIITKSLVHCHASCLNPIPPQPNECCPKCQGCHVNGMNYSDGQAVPSETSDPCINCVCQQGNVVCVKKACPVLPCPQNKFIQRQNTCCPECKGFRKVSNNKEKCFIGPEIFSTGEHFSYDECTRCFCNMSTIHCNRKVCPPLECPPSYQIKEMEQCCPRCQKPEETRSLCKSGGQIYQHGHQWQDGCSKCSCRHGQVLCSVEFCRFPGHCPPGKKMITLPGKCCSECIEGDGVCTVFGDPHYRTFDGKTFNFQGVCKYTLVNDCKHKRFSIQVVNDARYSKIFSWTKSVIFKIDDTKISLGQYRNIKVGKKRVRLPFVKLGVLSVEQQNYTVTVRTNLGIKLNWDGNSFLEIFMPSYFKDHLCGLCGNYNGNPDDDFITKKGNLVSDSEDFGNSWIIGKKRKCMAPRQIHSSRMTCDHNLNARVKAIRQCNVLKSDTFRSCHSYVNVMSYYRACVMDTCECPDNRKCYCESLFAYSQHCKQFNISLNWRKATGCEGSHCPRGSVYKSCVSPCRKTCKNYKHTKPCRRKCKPGCECIDGSVWYRNRCVPTSVCPE